MKPPMKTIMKTTKTKELNEQDLTKEIKSFIKWLYPILIKEGKQRVYNHFYYYKRLEKNKQFVQLTKEELEKYLKEKIPDDKN